MKIFFQSTLLLITCFVIYSCTSPLNKKYSEETLQKEGIRLGKLLDSNDVNLLAASILRLKIQEKNLEEMTFAQILEDGKKWKKEQDKIEAEQKALAEKAAREENEKTLRLTESVITCFEKRLLKGDYQDYINFKFAIQNKSDKTIRAIKGVLVFTNLFDDLIKEINFVYDQPILAGKQISWKASTDYNQFLDDDRALANKDLKDMKVVWKPEKIMFEDGSTLE